VPEVPEFLEGEFERTAAGKYEVVFKPALPPPGEPATSKEPTGTWTTIPSVAKVPPTSSTHALFGDVCYSCPYLLHSAQLGRSHPKRPRRCLSSSREGMEPPSQEENTRRYTNLSYLVPAKRLLRRNHPSLPPHSPSLRCFLNRTVCKPFPVIIYYHILIFVTSSRAGGTCGGGGGA
jgi:hypothetical protein